MKDASRQLHFRGAKAPRVLVQLATENSKLKRRGLDPLPTLADPEGPAIFRSALEASPAYQRVESACSLRPKEGA